MYKSGLLSLLIASLPLQAAEVSPPNWWANMAQPTVELMIHAPRYCQCGDHLISSHRPAA